MAAKKPKKPHGFVISRGGGTFTCGWAKGSGMGNDKYQDQKFEYYWAGAWHSIGCGKNTFSKSISPDFALTSSYFQFRVKAKWGDDWHGWYYSDVWAIYSPTSISCNVTTNPGSEGWPTSTCSWSAHDDPGDQYIFRYFDVYTGTSNSPGAYPASWAHVLTGQGSSGSYSIREDTSGWSDENYSMTRWFQVVAVGVGPDEAHKRVSSINNHVYARPAVADNVKGVLTPKTGGRSGYFLNMSWNVPSDAYHPIDRVIPKYAIVSPDTTVTTSSDDWVKTEISCPDNPQWVSLNPQYDVTSTGGATADISSEIPDNCCVFIQIDTAHDAGNNNIEGVSSSPPKLVEESFKRLSDLPVPTISPPEDPDVPIYNVALSSNPPHDAIDGVFVGIYYRLKSKPSEEIMAGVMSHTNITNTQDVRLPKLEPTEMVSFGVKAFVADYTPSEASVQGVTEFTPANIKAQSSNTVWTPEIPLPPVLTLNIPPGSHSSIEVNWIWTWQDATSAEISWADHADAWDSTDTPSVFEVSNRRKGRWIISNLDVGEWYVRIRLIKTENDSTIYGTYSSIYPIKLSATPATPTLWLSSNAMPVNGSAIVSWAYVSNDGTAQQSAWITEASYDAEGHIVYNESVYLETAGSQQHVTLYAADLISRFGWQPGEDHFVAVKVSSASGETSVGWSLPQPLTIVEASVCQITSHSLVTETDSVVVEDPITYEIANSNMIGIGEERDLDKIPDTVFTFGEGNQNGHLLQDDDPDIVSQFEIVNGDIIQTYPEADITGLYLTQLPLHVTVTGAGDRGIVRVAIERAYPFHVDRPDDSEYDGFEGETIAMVDRIGDGEVIIDKEDLLGYLDDGAQYRIVATVIDEYKQVNSSSLLPLDPSGTANVFSVRWNRQAHIPEGTFVIDAEQKISVITPIAPTGYQFGDTCDIYRLSADAPELIMPDAEFGVDYVDPYPALGKEFSGYRIVYKTIYGDYIDNSDPDEMPVPAWIDMDNSEDSEEVYPYLDLFGIVIDFGSDQVILPYNIDILNTWKKDFQTTKYLGGSTQGDWNPAVERTSSINTVTVVPEDPETLRLMRRLADYSGACHIRTPDGSSYPANINVKETRDERWVSKLAKFTLDVTRIDQQNFDAMTYAEWISNPES